MTTTFTAILNSSQEVGTGSTETATGTATLSLNTAGTALTYSVTISAGIDFGELIDGTPRTADPLDDAVLMHIHAAARGVNGGIVFDILPTAMTDDDDDLTIVENGDGSVTISGVWETTDSDPLAAGVVTGLQGGTGPNDVSFYFNIHTAQFGGGAIRGQLVTRASENADTFNGTATADVIDAFGGADKLRGAGGADSLTGGAGNDNLVGGTGGDTLAGGAGTDTAYYTGSAAGVTVNLGAGTASGGDAAGDILTGVEQLVGSSLADQLTGNAGVNGLWGDGGNDVLTGGAGADALKGGAGADSFAYTSTADSTVAAAGRDTINDFTTGDRINLSAIDANGAGAGSTAFVFGTGNFTGTAGELRVVAIPGGYQAVYGDTNGDKTADIAIVVLSDHALAAGDFVL
ncbi:Ca2+-binding RTX toxin-like protein [Inquilinus ginsengisoli]|uniref:CHRD domain-containing protein n=1 Tax=Inquilinus ginsengisoli TaxID=363840 RepID=UPI003D23BC23